MKRYSALVVMLLLLPACHQPPAYESPASLQSTTLTPTTSPRSLDRTKSVPAPATAPSQASFVDDFDRPDTIIGLGEGWDMRGREIDVYPIPLPAATDGFIRNGSFTYAGKSVVYAARQFRGTVQQLGASGRWSRIGRGTETTLAMAITPNENLITDMVHFTVNRSVWDLTLRRNNGKFEPVAKGHFSPLLAMDQDYSFELDVTDSSITVRVPGKAVTEQVSTAGLMGERAFWQQYPNGTPSGIAFEFDSVWAIEEGQPSVS